MAGALYTSVGLLAAELRHRPWLLMFLIAAQASVYLCAPIAAVWNLRAKAAPGHTERNAAAGPVRARRRRWAGWLHVPRPAAAAVTALCIGGVITPFVSPASLLHTTSTARAALSPQSLVASAGADAYLRVGSPATGAGTYYPITAVNLADVPPSSPGASPRVGLSFNTSSLVLLDQVLDAARDGGQISNLSLAFRTAGKGRRSTAERVYTFATGDVTAMADQFTGAPSGNVTLLLPGASNMTSTSPRAGRDARFAVVPAAPTSWAYVSLGHGSPNYTVTAVSLSQAGSGGPLALSFTTYALPLLNRIFQAEGATATIPRVTLSVGDSAPGGMLSHTFSKVSVSAFAESLSGPLSGTATLTGR
jgi:hypothetical protein